VLVVVALILLAGIPYTGNVDSGNGKGIRHIIPERILAAAVVAVVVAPFVEELIFRGVILRALRSRLSLVPAVLIQGVLFGAAHAQVSYGWANLGLILVLSTIGVVLGFYAAWRRRLGPTIIAHAIWNGIVVLVVALGHPAR
jgi:membrane protease YdiL (CAAX protease family)